MNKLLAIALISCSSPSADPIPAPTAPTQIADHPSQVISEKDQLEKTVDSLIAICNIGAGCPDTGTKDLRIRIQELRGAICSTHKNQDRCLANLAIGR